jgi:hypothetical protein
VWWVLAVVTGSAVIAAPGLLAVVRSVGVGHATDSGVVAPIPEMLLPAGVAASLVLAYTWRAEWRVPTMTGMVMLPALIGLGLAARVGILPTQYYPSKLIWHTAVLGLAPLAVVVAQGLLALRMSRSLRVGALRAIATVSLVGVVAFAALAPSAAQLHVWSTVDGDAVLSAVTSPGADRAQVVWLRSSAMDSTVTRILLDYFRAGSTGARTSQVRLAVAAECALLEGSPSPTVLSDQPHGAVLARYGCVPHVSTVQVSHRSE